VKIAYSYVRFSSRKQEQNDSVRRQIRLRDEWLKANPSVVLDTEISLQDLGVSAFRGANLDAEWGDLGKFIALVEKQDSPIPRGSYLLLERLDRFSRQKVSVAYTALMRLVHAGIVVVVLDPSPHQIDAENVDQMQVVLPIVTNLCLAHEQSREKSKRVSYAWKSRREDARQNGKIYTKRTPAWIKYDESTKKLVLDESKAAAIRHIFKRTIEGVGQVTLVRELNKDFPPIAGNTKKKRLSQWNTSYVCKILNDRSVIGEFQPHCIEDGKRRVADGEPIRDYFPRVIDEEVFYQAQYQKSLRKKEKTDERSLFVNLFTGLVWCNNDDSPMQIQTSRTKRKNGSVYLQRRLWSDSSRKGISGSCTWSIEYDAFESVVLDSLTELNPKNFQNTAAASEERSMLYQQIEGCAVKIREIEREAESLTSRMSIASALKMVDALSRKKESLELRLKSIAGVEDTSVDSAVEGLESVKSAIAGNSSPHNHSIRHKLRSLIPTIVEKIHVRLMKRKNRTTLAVVLVVLRDGTHRIAVVRPTSEWKNLKRILFYDDKKIPVFLISAQGSVSWDELHGMEQSEVKSMDEESLKKIVDGRTDLKWVLVDGKIERVGEKRFRWGSKSISAEELFHIYIEDQIADIEECRNGLSG
jgi:DNA invertase Pin-like site-specific DNA recombinase